MSEVTSIKASAWQRVVAELAGGVPDDAAFFDKLVAIVAQVSAARQGALLMPESGGSLAEDSGLRVVSVWGGSAGGVGTGADAREGGTGSAAGGAAAVGLGSLGGLGEGALEAVRAVKQAARGALESGQSRVVAIEEESSPFYEATGGKGYVLGVPVPAGGGAGPGTSAGAGGVGGGAGGGGVGGVMGVITLVIEARGKPAIQSTLAMAEVIAGYAHLHRARQQLRRTVAAGFQLDLATRLIAAINSAQGFKGACLQLVNDLAKQFQLDRVALGWVKSDQTRVEAISDTEHFDRRTQMVQRLQAAMDECLDQEQAVVLPQPGPEQDVLLSQAIVHAHRELAGGDGNVRVCSLPLRTDEEVAGVLTLEQSGAGKIDLATVELLQATMDLVTPVLRVRRSDDRLLAVRTWDSGVKASAWLVGPRHTVWKVIGVAAVTALCVVTFVRTTYSVGAEATLEPRTRRVVSAPFDGQIASLGEGVEPGASVKAGQTLLELDTTELRLRVADSQAQIVQAIKQADAAVKEGDTASAQRFSAQADQSRAAKELYEYRLAKSTLASPMDATIIQGDLRNRVGSTIKTGDALLELASLDEMIAVVRLDDRDVSLIHERLARGETVEGEVATKAHPGRPFRMTVERLVPMSESKEGKNTFEVRAKVHGAAGWLRPGMEARARLEVGRWRLIEIGSRRIINAVRLWLW